jgi:hypothetical protein
MPDGPYAFLFFRHRFRSLIVREASLSGEARPALPVEGALSPNLDGQRNYYYS